MKKLSAAKAATAFTVAGFRKLVEGYSGYLCTLRRASDNAEASFAYSGANDVLAYAAVQAWAAGSTVYLKRLFDQSGNGNDWEQTDTTKQAELAFFEGRAFARFDGANDILKTINNGPATTGYSVAAKMQLRVVNTSVSSTLFGIGTDNTVSQNAFHVHAQTQGIVLAWIHPNNSYWEQYSTSPGQSAPSFQLFAVTAFRGGASRDVNYWFTPSSAGVAGSSGVGSPTGNFVAKPFAIGARDDGTEFAQINFESIAIFPSVLTGTDWTDAMSVIDSSFDTTSGSIPVSTADLDAAVGVRYSDTVARPMTGYVVQLPTMYLQPIGGRAFIKGQIKVITVPAPARLVRLHVAKSSRVVAETWSDGSGNYRFDNLDPDLRYFVMAFDTEPGYDPTVSPVVSAAT